MSAAANARGSASRHFFVLGLTTWLGLAAPGWADEVYKCTTPQGGVAFQDHACAAAQQQQVIELAPVPAAPASTAAATTAATPSDDAAAPAPAVPPSLPRRGLPSLWSCSKYDGSQYVSSTGVPQQQAVPLGILGYPAQSLSQVYGATRGAAGAGVRGASGGHGAGARGLAGDYTWTEDQCVPMPIGAICTYLRTQLDANRRDQRNAPRTETPALEDHARELREQLDNC